MDTANVFQTIQLVIAPSVMISFGTFTLLIAVFITMSEAFISHRAMRAEVRWAMSLRPESVDHKIIPR